MIIIYTATRTGFFFFRASVYAVKKFLSAVVTVSLPETDSLKSVVIQYEINQFSPYRRSGRSALHRGHAVK